MARPLLEVADVLNRHGDAFVGRHHGHLSLGPAAVTRCGQLHARHGHRACRRAQPPAGAQIQRLPVYPDGKDHLFALELWRQLAQRQGGRVVCRSFASGNIDTERLRERRIPRCATPVNIHIDSRSGLEPISRRRGIRRARTASGCEGRLMVQEHELQKGNREDLELAHM